MKIPEDASNAEKLAMAQLVQMIAKSGGDVPEEVVTAAGFIVEGEELNGQIKNILTMVKSMVMRYDPNNISTLEENFVLLQNIAKILAIPLSNLEERISDYVSRCKAFSDSHPEWQEGAQDD